MSRDGARMVFDEWYRVAKMFAQAQINEGMRIEWLDNG